MVDYTKDPLYIPDTKTILSEAEGTYALKEAWKNIYGKYPSKKALAVLWAKVCLETGRFKSMHCFNFGNIKVRSNMTFTMYECGEEISLKQAQQLVKESPELVTIIRTYSWPNGSKRASVKIKAGHKWSQFVAHKTATEGAEYYIRFVSKNKRYFKAWQKLMAGDPVGYSHELKVAGYYTANEDLYTKGVVRLTNEFIKKSDKLMSWKPEVIADPEEEKEIFTDEEKTQIMNIIGDTMQMSLTDYFSNNLNIEEEDE